MSRRFSSKHFLLIALVLTAVLPAAARAQSSAPVAVDDSASTTVDAGVDIQVLINDYDPNPENMSLTITDVTQPDNGGYAYIRTGNANVIHFEPTLGFVGAASFSYTITNSYGLTATANVKVTVSGHLEVVTDIDQPHSYTTLYKEMAASGDKIEVWARVTPSDYSMTSVTANGVALTQMEPGSEWWSGSVTAISTLGTNPIEIVAADSNGGTATGTISYRTCQVLLSNSRNLWDWIMTKTSSMFMYSLLGKVEVIDDYNFWIKDGGQKIKVYCADGQHGLRGRTGFFKAHGVWIVDGSYLWVNSGDSICELH